VANEPRVNKAIQALASPVCKRLIALSACTARIEAALTSHLPRAHDAISAKLVVQHPPQAKLIDSVDSKPPRTRVQFVFYSSAQVFFAKAASKSLRPCNNSNANAITRCS